MTCSTPGGCECAAELAAIKQQLTEQNNLLRALADHYLGRSTTQYRAALLADLRKDTEQ